MGGAEMRPGEREQSHLRHLVMVTLVIVTTTRAGEGHGHARDRQRVTKSE